MKFRLQTPPQGLYRSQNINISFPEEVSCQKIFIDYFFDIFTLFAPQYTCFFVGQDNNKDNNSITLVPTLGLYVGNFKKHHINILF